MMIEIVVSELNDFMDHRLQYNGEGLSINSNFNVVGMSAFNNLDRQPV